MRGRESLVQIEVHDVDAEVAGAHFADQRIHVGAVHVEQAALGMQNVGNLVDVLLKHAERVGIGQHERGDIFIHLRRERCEIDHAPRVRLQILHGVIHHRSRGGIGSVRGIRNQNFLARIAFGLVIGADHQQAGHLAVRTGGRLQRDRIHPGDFDQLLAERLDDIQGALGNLLGLVGMTVRNSLHPRYGLVHAGVVLHGARAQRIHAQVDGIVPGGKSGEVSDNLDLAHFRHAAEIFSFCRAQNLGGIHFRHVQRRQLPGGLACGRFLEDQVPRSG